MSLVYSPDDDGYYWQAHDWTTSQVFPTRAAAEAARVSGRLVWS